MQQTTQSTTYPINGASYMDQRVEPSERASAAVAGGIGLAEGLAAAGALVLAVLALAGVLAPLLSAIACIAIGAGLIFEGSAIAARFSRIRALRPLDETDTSELGSGIAAESLGGAVGVVLGILALLGAAPIALQSIAVIVYGGCMLFGSGARARLNSMRRFGERGTLQQAVFISTGGEALIAVGALVLGILAVLGIAPVTLVLVAYLAVGGSLLLNGTAIGARMLSAT